MSHGIATLGSDGWKSSSLGRSRNALTCRTSGSPPENNFIGLITTSFPDIFTILGAGQSRCQRACWRFAIRHRATAGGTTLDVEARRHAASLNSGLSPQKPAKASATMASIRATSSPLSLLNSPSRRFLESGPLFWWMNMTRFSASPARNTPRSAGEAEFHRGRPPILFQIFFGLTILQKIALSPQQLRQAPAAPNCLNIRPRCRADF